jgi:hypothetical protein
MSIAEDFDNETLVIALSPVLPADKTEQADRDAFWLLQQATRTPRVAW